MTLSNLKQRKEDIRLGDPGILMPLIFNEDVNRIYRLGVIAHFVDMDSPKLTLWQQKFSNDTLFINVLKDPKDVITNIRKCDAIASSSLHGLIIADSYGIPNIRFVDRNTMPTTFYD